MKTKNKKSTKKNTSSLKKHVWVWPLLLVLAITIVSFQIVRANNDDNLPLASKAGSMEREVELDHLEQQQQFQQDDAYVQQQSSNAQTDDVGLSHVAEVLDDASR